jgi:hypothetical protein
VATLTAWWIIRSPHHGQSAWRGLIHTSPDFQVADAWRRPRLKAPERGSHSRGRPWHCYYDWRYDDGTFRFFEHPIHFTREQVYEGKYVRN